MLLLLKHTGPLALALAAGLAQGQSFEAASVKVSPTQSGLFTMKGGPGTGDPGRISYGNIPLRRVLLTAYDVKNFQLTGPDWLDTLRFDIAAKIPEGTGKEQFLAMLRNLLETRFRMKLHRESKEMPIYELAAAKNGPKLKPVAAQNAEEQIATVSPGEGPDGFPKVSLPSAGVVVETKNGVARITAKEVTLSRFADTLTARTGRPVFDRTNLEGTFTFVLYYTPEGASAADSPEPDLFSALQQQLGLRLEPRKGPVELLVIDHAEKTPIEN